MSATLSSATPWRYANRDVLRTASTLRGSDGALDRAVRDLARDWREVFGTNPVSAEADRAAVELVIGRDALGQLGVQPQSLEPEQWTISLLDLNGAGHSVALYGGGMRGDLYAVYEFSRLVFGVDRFHHWRDTAPPRRSSVEVSEITSTSPTFAERGWFLNDEDLLSSWAPDPSGGSGISLSVWDQVFETILRCGGNMVVPGTFLFPDEPHVRLAGARGLAVAQHHIEILGLNTYRWDDSVDYSFVDDPETMAAAWSEAVALYEQQEVVWSVGYRGRHDRPFWRDDRAVEDTPEARGKVISDAIKTQVDIIRETRPHDTIVHHLWMEGVELYDMGALELPSDVKLIWPDDGFGFVRDGGRIRAGEGAYYHVAMYNRFANQLTEAVPVERIASEVRRMVAAGATSHLIVNVSDIRPCVMTTEAIMEFAWMPPTESESASFVDRWARRLHGDDAGPILSKLWERYFELGWRPTPTRVHRLEDNGYHTFGRMLVAELLGGPEFDFEETRLPELVPDPEVFRPFRTLSNSREAVDLLLEGTRSAQAGWDELARDVDALVSRLDPSEQLVVGGHLGLQTRFHALANKMLHEIACTFVAFDSESSATWREHALGAEMLLGEQAALLRRFEYGRWKGWYAGDLFVNVDFTRRLVARLLADGPRRGLQPIPTKEEDLDLHVLAARDTYGAIKRYQGDRTVPGNR